MVCSKFSTIALIINKVQKDVWAVSHLYNQNNRFRIGTSFSYLLLLESFGYLTEFMDSCGGSKQMYLINQVCKSHVK